MIIQVKISELQAAAQLLRANPEMDRETFYNTMTAANPNNYTQEQIEESMQQVTQALVDLEYVETNEFEDIAPWVRGLPQAQVNYHLDAVHKEYLKTIEPLLLDEKIAVSQTYIDGETARKDLIASKIVGEQDDAWLDCLYEYQRTVLDRLDRAINEKKMLEQLRAMYP